MRDLNRLIDLIEDSKLWVQKGGNLALTELLEVPEIMKPHVNAAKIDTELQRAAIAQLLQAYSTLIQAYRSAPVEETLTKRYQDLLGGQI